MPDEPGPIIVPLDGSKNSEYAVPPARVLAAKTGAEVHLLHVVDPDDVPEGSDFSTAHEVFTGYADDLASKSGLDGHVSHLAEGKPADTILRYAREHRASLIAIASHGRGGFQAAFVGSVTDKVVRGAECPVLVVPAVGGGELRSPVLVALDGSAASEPALAAGRELAGVLGGGVTIMSAYRMPPPVGVEFTYYAPDMIDTFRTATEQYLQDIGKKGETLLAVQGSPAISIVETAKQIDAGLVVMATTGKGLAARLALGSTADRVMHTLHRPLYIVPAKEEG